MKQVLVTGANKGIGYEIARHLGKSGWQVIVGARDEGRAEAAVESLKKDGADIMGWQYVNLSDNKEIESSAKGIANAYPHSIAVDKQCRYTWRHGCEKL